MKFAIAGIAFILLVAIVVADQTTDSNEAVQTISGRRKMYNIFEEPCEKILANTSDPKELIKQNLDASVKNITNVLKIMTLWTNATATSTSTTDLRILHLKSMYKVCLAVLESARDDLNISMVLVDAFDASTTKEAVWDVRVKVSGVGTLYGTCSDAIIETETVSDKHACDKMMNLLNSSRDLAFIGLARFYCAYKKMWEEEKTGEKEKKGTMTINSCKLLNFK